MNKLAEDVNCRIGSLETRRPDKIYKNDVNCRIGSLEIWIRNSRPSAEVNCRIGSLEKHRKPT